MGKKIEWKDGRTVGKLAGSSLTLREGVEASFASNNYTTDVESLASHYTNVVTRFKTLVSMYPRVESTSLSRADNGITSFANIPVRPLSSLLQVLMHEGQSNQRGPCLPNACTRTRPIHNPPPSNFPIFSKYFSSLTIDETKRICKSFLRKKNNYSIQNTSITNILANSLIVRIYATFSSRHQ